jgi:hypothetical protein
MIEDRLVKSISRPHVAKHFSNRNSFLAVVLKICKLTNNYRILYVNFTNESFRSLNLPFHVIPAEAGITNNNQPLGGEDAKIDHGVLLAMEQKGMAEVPFIFGDLRGLDDLFDQHHRS